MLINGDLVGDATEAKQGFSKIREHLTCCLGKEFLWNAYRKILINWLQSLETMPPRWSETCTLEFSTSAAPTAPVAEKVLLHKGLPDRNRWMMGEANTRQIGVKFKVVSSCCRLPKV